MDLLALGDLDGLDDDLDALVDAKHGGAQAHLVVLGGAPGAAGVVLVVDTAALVLLGQSLLGGLLRLAVQAVIAEIGTPAGSLNLSERQGQLDAIAVNLELG